jgi:hypothetical protein
MNNKSRGEHLNDALKGFPIREDVNGCMCHVGDHIRVHTSEYYDSRGKRYDAVTKSGRLVMMISEGLVLNCGDSIYKHIQVSNRGNASQTWELISDNIGSRFEIYKSIAMGSIERIFNISRKDFMKKGKGSRKLEMFIPRYLYIYALFETVKFTKITEQAIGDLIGWNRVTCRYANRVVREELESDRKYGIKVFKCKKEINGLINQYFKTNFIETHLPE